MRQHRRSAPPSVAPDDSPAKQADRGPHIAVELRWAKRLVPLVLAGLAVHLLVPQLSGFSQMWDTIGDLRWPLVVAALAAQLASYVGSGVLLQGLVGLAGDRLRVSRGMLITLASGAIGLVAAGIVGATAATYTWIRRGSERGDGAGLAASLKPVFNNAALLVVAVFACIHLLILGDLSATEAVGFAIVLAGLVAVTGGLAWAATHPVQLRRNLTKVRRWFARAARTDHDAATAHDAADADRLRDAWLALRDGGWKRPLLGAAGNVFFDAGTLYLLFVAAGDRIGVSALLTGYSVALLLGKAAFLPGGLGVVEATMLAIYTGLGADRSAAVVAVLAYRLISFWVPALLGFPVCLYLQRDRAAPARSGPAAPGRS